MQKKYLILAYYSITNISDPALFVKEHKKFFKNKDIKGRIYISQEGINGQMSGEESDCEVYMSWLKEKPGFESIPFKVEPADKNIFFKLTVKVREQLVAFDQKVDFSKAGKHISPQDWKKAIEEKQDYIMIDVRNDYETKIGHFETAELPKCDSFRDFIEYTEKDLIEKRATPKDKKILMCCTGGIRCEYYSAYLKEKGFDNVQQLDGGIINYGHQVGSDFWKGKLFVFDDRLVAKVGKSDDCISGCHHCEKPSDTYYNCANMDCNFLFTCCSSCLKEKLGCCCTDCQSSERLRPYNEVTNAPFRKWYHYMAEEKQQA